MKPIFVTSTALQVRLCFAIFASLILIVFDSKFDSFVNIRMYFNTGVAPLIYAANIPGEMLQGVSQNVSTRQDLQTRVKEQEKKLFLQQTQLLQFSHLKKENQRLRALLNSPMQEDSRKLVAELVTVNLDPFALQIMVNKGSTDGVYIGQPVLNEQGVVGQVVDVSATLSRILLISDITHAVPVRVQRNDIRVLANGSGELNELSLPYVPQNTDIQKGDILVTSGLGGVFPEGYPVATVTSFTSPMGDAYAQVSAKPIVALERLRYVLLVWQQEQPLLQNPSIQKDSSKPTTDKAEP